jgi:hypothetical protein
MADRKSTRFWPNPVQQLLLDFCLHPDDDRAREAWGRWKKSVNLDDLDQASFRIMSLAYTRLVGLKMEDPELGRIKGIFRYQWTRNQIAFRGKAEVLRAFAAASIPTLLLKGAALCRTAYPDATARPMHDLDFLIPVTDAARGIQLLQEGGWRAQHRAPQAIIPFQHALSFLHDRAGELDLHWHVMRSQRGLQQDAGWWDAAVEHVFEGAPTRILCPADQFLHACEHALHHSPSSSLQWLVDACLIVRRFRSPGDWERLVEQTRAFDLALPVRRTLAYLGKHFGDEVPPAAQSGLSRIRVGWLARAEYFLAGRPGKKRENFVHRQAVLLGHYLRIMRGRPLREAAGTFPRYVLLLNHCDRPVEEVPWDLAKVAIHRGFQCQRDLRLYWLQARSGSHPLVKTNLRDFHRPAMLYRREIISGQAFAWTKPEGSLALDLPRKDGVLIWEFPEFCQASDIRLRGADFALNGHPLPGAAGTWHRHSVAFPVSRGWLRKNGRQTLSWSIAPLQPGTKDRRSLGLPAFRIWFLPGLSVEAVAPVMADERADQAQATSRLLALREGMRTAKAVRKEKSP